MSLTIENSQIPIRIKRCRKKGSSTLGNNVVHHEQRENERFTTIRQIYRNL